LQINSFIPTFDTSSNDVSFKVKAEKTIFYFTEKAIKLYRRFAQSKIKAKYKDITIDQILVLEKIEESPAILHSDLAAYIFKDVASLSRMLTLLEKNQYIKREIDPANRRRFKIKVTKKGLDALTQIKPVIAENRKIALKGISKKDLETCKKVLSKISSNTIKNIK